jgi:isopentenyl-diphosphate delta-isomerase
MGFGCDLRWLFTFTYRVEMEDGLWEHEVDHVFVGRHDADPMPDPEEVGEWRWVSPRTLRAEMDREPDRFTPWLAPALSGLMRRLPADSNPRATP